MYLLFYPQRSGISYAACTTEGAIVYDGFIAVSDWSPRSLNKQFSNELLTRVRGHGRVFQKVGIILPFGEFSHTASRPADQAYLKKLATSRLRQRLLEPSVSLYQASRTAWPHLPHSFLSDTHLSIQLEKTTSLPPVSYEFTKRWQVESFLVHSYGHRANMMLAKTKDPFISLFIGEQVSVALCQGDKILDTLESFAPLSPVLGIRSSASFDAGWMAEMAERKSGMLGDLILMQSGLQAMTETQLSIDDLIYIAGLVPRKNTDHLERLSIEAIEWIELSMRQFIRSLQHAIGALRARHETSKVVIGSSYLTELSPLWELVFTTGLADVKTKFVTLSPLEAACQDLIPES